MGANHKELADPLRTGDRQLEEGTDQGVTVGQLPSPDAPCEGEGSSQRRREECVQLGGRAHIESLLPSSPDSTGVAE